MENITTTKRKRKNTNTKTRSNRLVKGDGLCNSTLIPAYKRLVVTRAKSNMDLIKLLLSCHRSLIIHLLYKQALLNIYFRCIHLNPKRCICHLSPPSFYPLFRIQKPLSLIIYIIIIINDKRIKSFTKSNSTNILGIDALICDPPLITSLYPNQ